MFEALQPHPEDHLHLRLHRARSVILTSQELVEIRATQRTFEGAYMRTAISQFSFALIILRIFTSEFYAIGALFAAYGIAIMLVAIHRRFEGNRQFFDREESEDESPAPARPSEDDAADTADATGRYRRSGAPNGSSASQQHRHHAPSIYRHRSIIVKKFRTSANSIALLTALSLGAYITLMVLIWNLEE